MWLFYWASHAAAACRCGHCKSMAQAWEDLGSEYEASSSVLIGNVDCTVQSEVCSKYGVSGYPTIKYYKDGDKEGQSYNGGRSLDALKAHVADNLEVKCQVADPKGCSDKEKKFIETMQVQTKQLCPCCVFAGALVACAICTRFSRMHAMFLPVMLECRLHQLDLLRFECIASIASVIFLFFTDGF